MALIGHRGRCHGSATWPAAALLVVALAVGLSEGRVARGQTVRGESVSQSSRTRAEILHELRRDKLDIVLPLAMRDNGVDMWIHVIRAGNPDPLEPNFGSAPSKATTSAIRTRRCTTKSPGSSRSATRRPSR